MARAAAGLSSGTREVLRCLLEGLRWLWGAEAVRVAGKSGIPQARTRPGADPLRRLYERVVRPIATPATKGARYRAWRLFGARLGAFADGEATLARDALTALRAGMLCLADRQFFGHALWRGAAATGADLLWRGKRNLRPAREAVVADGSFPST